MKKKIGIEPREVDLFFGKPKPLTVKDQLLITEFVKASKQKYKPVKAATDNKKTKPRQTVTSH